MLSRNDIFQKVTSLLEELFELDPAEVTEESLLYEDLDIDSIDAVDLIIELKSYTGKKIGPDDFKAVRSVGDIVTAVQELLENG